MNDKELDQILRKSLRPEVSEEELKSGTGHHEWRVNIL